MEAKEIVEKEVARQAGFGMEPSWEDFAIAGYGAGIKEVVEWFKKTGMPLPNNFVGMYIATWQAKLKEWGIK